MKEFNNYEDSDEEIDQDAIDSQLEEEYGKKTKYKASKREKDTEDAILLIGVTGSGKSSLANVLALKDH